MAFYKSPSPPSLATLLKLLLCEDTVRDWPGSARYWTTVGWPQDQPYWTGRLMNEADPDWPRVSPIGTGRLIPGPALIGCKWGWSIQIEPGSALCDQPAVVRHHHALRQVQAHLQGHQHRELQRNQLPSVDAEALLQPLCDSMEETNMSLSFRYYWSCPNTNNVPSKSS